MGWKRTDDLCNISYSQVTTTDKQSTVSRAFTGHIHELIVPYRRASTEPPNKKSFQSASRQHRKVVVMKTQHGCTTTRKKHL